MQPPDELGPVEPGLERLLGVLTSGPTTDELAGEQAALTMFRASQQTTIAGPAGTRPFPAQAGQAQPALDQPGGARRRGRSRRSGLTGRRSRAIERRPAGSGPAGSRPAGRRRTGWLAGALALALAAGFAAAAYTAALPAPVQHVAYRVLGFVGVPDSRQPAARPRGSQSSSPAGHHPRPSRSGSPQPGRSGPAPRASATPSPSASPTPRPSRSTTAPRPVPAQLTLTAAAGRITAGSGDSFTGMLTDSRDRAVPGQRLILLERTAGEAGWQQAGQAVTGASGRAVLTVSNLTGSALFWLTGPDGTRSQKIRVIADPPVSVTVGTGPRGRAAVLTVTSPLADPGDLVMLQVQAGGAWQGVRAHRLSQADEVVFEVRLRRRAHEYRVVVLRTGRHGRSVSSPVLVPPTGG